MAAHVRRHEGAAPHDAEVEAAMRAEGLDPHRWGNGPGDAYRWHEHGYHKVLYCLEGGITFHTRSEGDLTLGPGDRLDIEAGTAHAATVGDDGVQCIEAPR